MLDILIVEDNPEIGNLLMAFLRKENYSVTLAPGGEKALELFSRYGAKLVILDLMLAGIDGYAVCSEIRKTSNAHILIASARTGKEAQLKGLELGADDYIEKPYDIDILLAKVRGIFKRKYAQDILTAGELTLNIQNSTVTDGGRESALTAKELELLRLFMENPGVTLKKEYIFNTVWGSDSESEPQTLAVHVKWLREKIEKDPKNPEHIITVWGVGYRFEQI